MFPMFTMFLRVCSFRRQQTADSLKRGKKQMSKRGKNKKSERRKDEHKKIEIILRKMLESDPVFIRSSGYDEIWKRGPMLLVIPAIIESYPTELKDALSARRYATLNLYCVVCDAVPDIASISKIIGFAHNDGCIATNESIRDIVMRNGGPDNIKRLGMLP